MKLFHAIFLILFLVLFSCTKKVESPSEPNVPSEERGRSALEEEQLLKDSVYYYYKLYSLWEKSIPKYDPISVYTKEFSSASSVLSALMSLTPSFPAYRDGTYDRFSYLTDLGYNGNFGSALRMDSNEGLGLSFAIGAINDTVAYPFVNFVEGGSPAQLQGIVRSDMVMTLNEVDMEIKIKCIDGNCEAIDRSKYSSILSQLRNALGNSSLKLKIRKGDDSIKSYTLASTTYDIDPLILDTVFSYSNMNVGYFAYSSFEEIENNNINQRKVDALFDRFETNSIKSLIVDLRYNGGGYVDAAIYLADKIINSSGKNKLMLTYELNEYLSKSKNSPNSTFKDVYFTKKNNLELETVCFIVTNGTASAAEMLINVLKPYMNVKIVAEDARTYGKPVGFFPQKILNRAELWVTSFKLINSNKESDYWNGLLADKTNVSDYIFLNFGNKDENMLAEALALTGAVNNQARMRISSGLNRRGLKKIKNVNEVIFRGALKNKQ